MSGTRRSFIVRRRVMARIVESAGIGKARMGRANLMSFFRHAPGERRHAACHVLRNGGGGVVARNKHHAVKEILQPIPLAPLQPHRRAFHIRRRAADFYRVVQTDLIGLQRGNQRHDFRGAGRIAPLVHHPLIEYFASKRVDDHCRARCHVRQRVARGDIDGRILPFFCLDGRRSLSAVFHFRKSRREPENEQKGYAE